MGKVEYSIPIRSIPAREVAQFRDARNRGTFICHGIPGGYIFGYDTVFLPIPTQSSINSFCGIKDIPLNKPHIFWICPGDRGAGVRTGILLWPAVDKVLQRHSLARQQDQIFLSHWNAKDEVLVSVEVHDHSCQTGTGDLLPYSWGKGEGSWAKQQREEAESKGKQSRFDLRSKLRVPDMPDFITKSSPETLWAELVSDISPAVLTRVIGKPGAAGEWLVSTLDTVRGEAESALERELDATMPPSSSLSAPARHLDFLFSQSDRMFDTRVTGRERTEQALDSTAYICSVLGSDGTIASARDPERQHQASPSNIVGDFQLCFLLALFLGSPSCAEYWWWLFTHVILRAYRLPAIHPELVARLFRLFLAQIAYIRDHVEAGNFWDSPPPSASASTPHYSHSKLQKMLTLYHKRLAETDDMGVDTKQVKTALEQLELWLGKIEGWDIGGVYLREGIMTLEDGEEVYVRVKDADADMENEEGEFAPMVVEVDEMGRETGLLRWDD